MRLPLRGRGPAEVAEERSGSWSQWPGGMGGGGDRKGGGGTEKEGEGMEKELEGQRQVLRPRPAYSPLPSPPPPPPPPRLPPKRKRP